MISIGLPAIKSSFLSDAISSILDQRYKEFELIVVNDRKDLIIREKVLSFNDSRIRYIEEDTILPVVNNWNRVLSYSKGDLFILFSDDDICHPDFLSELILLANRYPACDIFHCRVKKIDENGDQLELTTECPEYETGLEFLENRLKGNREHFAPEFMVRTDKLKAIGGFVDLPCAWGSDDLTWFRLSRQNGIAYSAEPLVSWRRSPDQISISGSFAERLLAAEKYGEWIKSFILSVNPTTDQERNQFFELEALLPGNLENQKTFLMTVHAQNHNLIRHLIFFLKYRNRRKLKFRWVIYSLSQKFDKRKFNKR